MTKGDTDTTRDNVTACNNVKGDFIFVFWHSLETISIRGKFFFLDKFQLIFHFLPQNQVKMW